MLNMAENNRRPDRDVLGILDNVGYYNTLRPGRSFESTAEAVEWMIERDKKNAEDDIQRGVLDELKNKRDQLTLGEIDESEYKFC